MRGRYGSLKGRYALLAFFFGYLHRIEINAYDPVADGATVTMKKLINCIY